MYWNVFWTEFCNEVGLKFLLFVVWGAISSQWVLEPPGTIFPWCMRGFRGAEVERPWCRAALASPTGVRLIFVEISHLIWRCWGIGQGRILEQVKSRRTSFSHQMLYRIIVFYFLSLESTKLWIYWSISLQICIVYYTKEIIICLVK